MFGRSKNPAPQKQLRRTEEEKACQTDDVESYPRLPVQKLDAETQAGQAFIKGFKLLGKSSASYQPPSEDPITEVLGEFGRWQLLISVLLFFFNIPCVFQIMVSEFEGSFLSDVWCSRPEKFMNLSVEKWKKISGALKISDGSDYDPCYIKDMNYNELDPDDPNTWRVYGPDIKCHRWEYGTDKESIISEFELPCEPVTPTSLAESLFAVGGLIGSILGGYYIDKIGRRKLLLISQGCQALVSLMTALSPWYWSYMLLRLFQGFFTISNIFSSVILCQEITGRDWMGVVGASYMYSYPLGYIIVAVLAHSLDKWRHLHYSFTFASVILLATWWVLPESPRWLWIQKDIVNLIDVLEDAAHINGRKMLTDIEIRNLEYKGPMTVPKRLLKVKLKDLYSTPIIKKLSMTTPFLFFFTYFSYYGIVLRLNGMYTSDVYRTVLFTGIVEFTATSVCLGFTGRNWINTYCVLFFSSVTAGALCLFINTLPSTSDGIPYCLIFARFFMSMMNANLLTAVTELYPTKMRALGAGWANLYMNLGLLCTANMFNLSKEGVFLMGISGLVAGILVLFLPPPLWYGLPDIIEQVETPYIVIGR